MKESLEEHGKLDPPDQTVIELNLQESSQTSQRAKGSRVDRALEKLREEQKEKSEQDMESARMSMTNKSRILEQM